MLVHVHVEAAELGEVEASTEARLPLEEIAQLGQVRAHLIDRLPVPHVLPLPALPGGRQSVQQPIGRRVRKLLLAPEG